MPISKLISKPTTNYSHLISITFIPRFLKELILNSDFQEPEIPIISNVTAKEETDKENIKNLLIEQIYSKVRWREIVEFMIKNKVSEIYELGPGKSLSAMIKRFNTDIVLQNCNSMEEVNKLSKLL